MIIPEAKTAAGYRLSVRHPQSYEEGPSGRVFDAGFIESVYVHGFNKAQDIRSNQASNDDMVIDALFRDMMMNGGQSYDEFTDLFVRVREVEGANDISGAQKSDDGGRTPVANTLWIRAEAIARKAWKATSVFADSELHEAHGNEVWFNGSRSRGHKVLAEVTLSQADSPILSLWISESFDTTWEGDSPNFQHYGAAFHYKYEPHAAAENLGWLVPTWLSLLARGGPSSRPNWAHYGDYTFVLRDEDGEFEIGGLKEPHFKRPAGYDDELCIINGLIRIHNHLNNPGMTDEAYRQLLG